MPPVFGHGRLRLYLLKLLGEAPRHGYEVIRLLEERFQGLYAPSAGTVYPRLAKLEAEGLVSHAEEGGRKVYSLTGEGHRELRERASELTELEREISDSLTALAANIREDVRGSAQALRQQIKEATATLGPQAAGPKPGRGRERSAQDAWQAAARQAEEESRRARQEARRAREESEALKTHVEQAARRIQEQVQSRARAGDWPGAVREGLDGLGREIAGWSRFVSEPSTPWPQWVAGGGDPEAEAAEAADPERELLRLLDRLRDEVRDAARDHGVSQEQLREARRHLSTAAAHVVGMLRMPRA